MATFYSSANNQRDFMQALYIRDHGNSSYPESGIDGNILYLNSTGPYPEIISASNAESQQNFMQLPLSNSVISQDSSFDDHELASSHLIEHTYSAWGHGKQETLMHAIAVQTNAEDNHFHRSVAPSAVHETQMGLHPEVGILSIASGQNQGLSLSLGTHIPISTFQYRATNTEPTILDSRNSVPVSSGLPGDDNLRGKQMPIGPVPSSRYIKAARELLDEVVNVSQVLKNKDKNHATNSSAGATGCKDNDGASKNEEMNSSQQESSPKSSTELSPSERQELQNKITKLLTMLDEVDKRYKQYFHQMQIVVSSFDVVAGFGAAKPYTTLALQTISRHFRSLRDAISSQIRSTRKNLGEEDYSNGKGGGNGGGIPRLRYVDQKLRQQRAMQQLGMMQPQAWRPQRGLPESSVSILRAWLFEHFLHPYPTDSEKLMLARQTGLSRSQVSNWFINARVRLWKPMIEDIYKEEVGDGEIESNSSSNNTPKGPKEAPLPESVNGEEDPQSPSLVDNRYTNLKLHNHQEDFRLLPHDSFAHDPDEESSRFVTMAALGGYGNGGVSLTLGLQNSQQDMYAAAAAAAPPPLGLGGGGVEAVDFDYMNLMVRSQGAFQNAHNLHDFVS